MEQSKKCPKCQGEMIKGQITEFTPAGIMQSIWTTLSGKKILGITVNRIKSKVDTYACKKCGFLESYLQDIPSFE